MGWASMSRADRRLHAALWSAAAAVLAWSAWRPHDYFTWFLEVLPVFAAAPLLLAAYRRFHFSRVVSVLLLLHAIVLMIGGHYTYALVPAFSRLRDALHLARNDYDKVGHLMQGFVPALVARELLLRYSPLKRGKWLFFIVVSICLAISASYELFEWGVAEATGAQAEAFLGTQGDPWDTQEDMACALIGALAALGLLSAAHDRSLERLAAPTPAVSVSPAA